MQLEIELYLNMNQLMYHTQEDRGTVLNQPILCERKDAWFGTAYYFWVDEVDAIRWGIKSKNNRYQIYSATIISDNVLDTVFNKDHYLFFISALERTAKTIVKLTGKKPTQVDICEYLNTRAKRKEKIDVLLACDIPQSPSEILPIPVRKRIQAAVYNINCIKEFQLKD